MYLFAEISYGKLKNNIANARVREAEAIRDPIFSQVYFLLRLSSALKARVQPHFIVEFFTI